MKRRAVAAGLRPFLVGVAILGVVVASFLYESGAGRRPAAGPDGAALPLAALDDAARDLAGELQSAAARLPLAAALGAILALRPRRRGAPKRDPAVVETQIVLAVVGAIVMLIVGASLSRAFAIVGVASLVRYRSKVRSPKDAVVMLSALAVGLAAGVGLIALASFSTLFVVTILWVIEGFEPRSRTFELSVRLGDRTAELRPRIESVLRGLKTTYELRAVSAGEASYRVTAPPTMRTDSASRALTALAPDAQPSVKWNEKPRARAE